MLILLLIIPFPLAFLLHEAEEVLLQHRWMLAHHDALKKRFPKLKPLLTHLSRLTTKAFAVAAFEEWLIITVATCYVLIQGDYCLQIWSALFMAFSFHQLTHIVQAFVVRGYVPGIATSLLLLPYSFMILQSIWYFMSGLEMLLWGMSGIIVMIVNLRFAHWLGMSVAHKA